MKTENQERVIDKIRKVLELSKNNPSEEEAKSAALMAQKLMAQYHIELKDIEDVSDIDEIVEQPLDVSAFGKWKQFLASVVANNFRCKVYLKGRQYVVFYGYETDTEIASEVYSYLLKTGTSLATKLYYKYLKETGSAQGVMNKFYRGFMDGVSSELGKQCTALLIITPPEVEEGFEEFSKDFKHSTATLRSRYNEHAAEIYKNGFESGKSSVQNRQIEGGK